MFADAFGQYDYGSTSRLARGLVLFDSRRSRPLALRRRVSHEYTGYSRWSVMRPLQNTVLLAIVRATRSKQSMYYTYADACFSEHRVLPHEEDEVALPCLRAPSLHLHPNDTPERCITLWNTVTLYDAPAEVRREVQ